MRKGLALVVFLCLALGISACSGKGGTASRVSAIPGDGVVSKKVFSQLKESGDIAIFTGENGGVKYRWTFVGSDIDEPADADLRVNFDMAQEAKLNTAGNVQKMIGFSFASEQAKPGRPVLEFVLDQSWQDGKIAIFSYDGAQPRFVCDASFNDSKTVAFEVKEYAGKFYCVLLGPEPSDTPKPDKTQEPSAVGDNQSPEKTDEQPQQNKPNVSPTNKPAKEQQKPQAQNTPTPEPDAAIAAEPKPTAPKVPTVSISINCHTARANFDKLDPSAKDDRIVPPSGQILSLQAVELEPGETVFDVLKRVCRQNNIHMESSYTPVGAAYVEGINNLYEFACGPLSGWLYSVNGKYSSLSSSSYKLQDGDVIEWNYSCDLGRDLGQSGVVQQSR